MSVIAGLCYNTIRPGFDRTIYVKFEDVLARLNRPDEIEKFLKLRYDNEGYFAKRFYTLARKVIPLLQPYEQFIITSFSPVHSPRHPFLS